MQWSCAFLSIVWKHMRRKKLETVCPTYLLFINLFTYCWILSWLPQVLFLQYILPSILVQLFMLSTTKKKINNFNKHSPLRHPTNNLLLLQNWTFIFCVKLKKQKIYDGIFFHSKLDSIFLVGMRWLLSIFTIGMWFTWRIVI